MKIYKITFLILSLVIMSTLALSCKKSAPIAIEEYKLENTKQNYEIPIQKLATVSLIENVTTGYSWHYLITDENILIFSSEERIATSGDKNIVGAPMVHTWKFKAMTPGTTTLKFAYCREWEAKALESKIGDNPKFPKLKAFTAMWQASIETREYIITIK